MDAKDHWAEGHRYAAEGIKVMLLINGGAATGLLTFIGHSPALRTPSMAWAMIAFGVGALLAAINFLFAYLAQLYYGKKLAATDPLICASHNCKATLWHVGGYIVFLFAAALFVTGLFFARSAIITS